MIVARSSGDPVCASASRSSASPSSTSGPSTSPPAAAGSNTTIDSSRSSLARTGENRSTKSEFSNTATFAPQCDTRYSTWSDDEEL